ncbi:MAG: response regulator transcription factor [Chloroflexi bacterium]|nr:response regulator transcription factor [Chloroflexota bacterium]
MTIRVLIVDDHEIVRSGMQLMLEDDDQIELIGEAENGEDAVRLAVELLPDVVIMDITLPDINGIEATRRIKAQAPEVAVLAMTIHEEPEYFFEMLKAGASGYVPKRVASEELFKAIEVVAAGHVFLEPVVAKNLVTDYLELAQSGGDEKARYDGLTPREREVLTLIARDYTNQAIANKLGISVKTVERHRENMMHKLELHSRTALVKYAIRKGLIDL